MAETAASRPREVREDWLQSRAPWMSRNAILGGIGAAVVAGLVLGAAARPDLGDERPTPRPMTPSAEEAAVTPLPVELAAVRTTSAAAPAGKLEVLPPGSGPAPRRAPAQAIALPAVSAAPVAGEPPAVAAAARELNLAEEPEAPALEAEPLAEDEAPADEAPAEG